MTTWLSGISITDRNTDIPFFPNQTYNIVASDYDTNLPVFNWIQAFFDSSFAEVPQLAVFTGAFHDDGSPILSGIEFAYSGHMIQIKGMGIFEAGTNIRDQSVSSVLVNPSSPTDSFRKIIAYGGMK